MKKGFLWVLLCGLAALSAGLTSCGFSDAAPDMAPDGEITGPSPFDILCDSRVVMDQPAVSNGDSAWYQDFSTTAEDPAYRVCVENNGADPLQVLVKRGGESSREIMAECDRLAPGDQIELERITNHDTDTPGKRWVVLNPVNGTPIDATVSVRIAPSASEVS